MAEELPFPILIERDEEGMYVVSCPALRGCYSQGGTYEEALENIKEAIQLYLEIDREGDREKSGGKPED